MQRWLRAILALLAVVLAATASAFWVRSYWVWDLWASVVVTGDEYVGTSDAWEVNSSRGGVVACTQWFEFWSEPPHTIRWVGTDGWVWRTWTAKEYAFVPGNPQVGFRIAGFEVGADDRSDGGPGDPTRTRIVHRGVVVPHAFVVCLSLSLAVPWLLHRRQAKVAARRARAGLCVACGYDLRASPGPCPECGRSRAARPAGLLLRTPGGG